MSVGLRSNAGAVATLYPKRRGADGGFSYSLPNLHSERIYYYRFSRAFPPLAMIVSKTFNQLAFSASCVMFSDEVLCQHLPTPGPHKSPNSVTFHSKAP